MAVFPALLRLRRTHPGRPRALRVPGGAAGAVAASALATGRSAVALAASLWPGLGTAQPWVRVPLARQRRPRWFVVRLVRGRRHRWGGMLFARRVPGRRRSG
jgi:hypothetical protein